MSLSSITYIVRAQDAPSCTTCLAIYWTKLCITSGYVFRFAFSYNIFFNKLEFTGTMLSLSWFPFSPNSTDTFSFPTMHFIGTILVIYSHQTITKKLGRHPFWKNWGRLPILKNWGRLPLWKKMRSSSILKKLCHFPFMKKKQKKTCI